MKSWKLAMFTGDDRVKHDEIEAMSVGAGHLELAHYQLVERDAGDAEVGDDEQCKLGSHG
jgi:hypothetical protein